MQVKNYNINNCCSFDRNLQNEFFQVNKTAFSSSYMFIC